MAWIISRTEWFLLTTAAGVRRIFSTIIVLNGRHIFQIDKGDLFLPQSDLAHNRNRQTLFALFYVVSQRWNEMELTLLCERSWEKCILHPLSLSFYIRSSGKSRLGILHRRSAVGVEMFETASMRCVTYFHGFFHFFNHLLFLAIGDRTRKEIKVNSVEFHRSTCLHQRLSNQSFFDIVTRRSEFSGPNCIAFVRAPLII